MLSGFFVCCGEDKQGNQLWDLKTRQLSALLDKDSGYMRDLSDEDEEALSNELKDDLEIIFCINANDIEKNKVRAEYDITYDVEVLRLIDNLTKLGFDINSVVITLYNSLILFSTVLGTIGFTNVYVFLAIFFVPDLISSKEYDVL